MNESRNSKNREEGELIDCLKRRSSMKNELILPDLKTWDLQSLSEDELMDVIREGLQVSAYGLVRTAMAIKELESRGKDLSGFKISFLPFLRLVASGQLMVEVLVQFIEQPGIVRILSRLPLPDQKRIADGESIKLVVYGKDGGFTSRMFPVKTMDLRQVRQCIGYDKIRTETEQIALLESQKTRARQKPKREVLGKFILDRERGGLIHRREFLTEQEIKAALSALRNS